MKAAYVNEPGAPDQLTYGDMPEPTIGPDEVLVRVRACALNRRDTFIRDASHGERHPLPVTPGMEVAGEVAQIGQNVAGFNIGDKVLGLTPGGRGGYAEYARVHKDDLHFIPQRLSYEEAACIPVVFSTAWHMLICRAKLAIGEDALIMAAGSGVGSAAIQIAKRLGARVITTASTDDKVEKAKLLGADDVINYTQDDFAEKARELTGGQGVDVVLDHIGAPVWPKCFASLKVGGRFITCGVTAGHRVEFHLGQLWTRDLSIMGTRMRPREDLPVILKVMARGELRPVVSQVFPLPEAAQAHKAMEESNFFGKLVLRM